MLGTLARLFRHTVSYNKTDAILTKIGDTYQPISSQELYRRVGRLHIELARVGIRKGDRCAVLSENRWEWAVADFAMMTAGIVSVPLYPTLSAQQICDLLEHSEARAVMLSTREQLGKIKKNWGLLPNMAGAVVFDSVDDEDERVTTLEDLIGEIVLTPEEVEQFERAISQVQPDDLASIIYTSGTTGIPKGVMLSHANFASNVLDNGFDINGSDVCLSFLPLSHVAERTADYVFYFQGATVAYAESIDTVPLNMMEVRPTIVLGVPRFFEKVYARVMGKVADGSPFRQKLFHWAVKVGGETISYRLEKSTLPLSLRLRHFVADHLVLSKLRSKLGGRIRYFVSGAAPLAKHLGEFFFSVGIRICEAYGLTETSPIISTNYPDSLRFGTVGRVIPNVEVKIAKDEEILVRGPNVMQGYFKMETASSEAIVDGWLHTGDIGNFDEDGYLIITDRKKDLLKTSGGKYIAPQPIENQLKTCEFVSMAVVIAEGRKFPSALIVPNFDRLKQYATANGLSCANERELAGHVEIVQMLEAQVEQACKNLAQYEQIKKIAVLEREFSLEEGEITPTMKVRRKVVLERYAARIGELYD